MKFAFVFPGQGSQSTGMLSAFAADFPVINDVFSEASDALGYDLWDLVQNAPTEKLNQTEFTQPAMLAAGYATWKAFESATDIKPDLMAGHSLGEYTALTCAGSLSLSDGVKLVTARGQLMQSAVPDGKGAMAAILGLDDETIVSICETASAKGIVQAVNFNSPGQVVIAGETAAVENAMELAKEAKAKRALKLPVSVPSHSALMKDAAEQFAEKLAAVEFSMPAIPVYHNVTAKPSTDITAMIDALKQQLYSPVLWVDTVNNLIADGAEATVECGPGKVLAGLNKRINKAAASMSLDTPDNLQKVIAELKQA